MQVVILAAGKGIRCYPLTLNRPKPLLPLAGTSILKHNLSQLPKMIKEVILIIGFEGEATKKEIGNHFQGKKIDYIFQEKLLGTGDAVFKARPFVKDKFLVLNGDDIYQNEDLKKCLLNFPSMLVKKVEKPENFGQVIIKDKLIERIVEKPKRTISFFVNAGAYFLPKSIFNFPIEKSSRGEYEITDFLTLLISKGKLHFAKAAKWFPVTYPWDLLLANENFLEKIKRKIQGKISPSAKIKGRVVIEKGSEIFENVVIEGPVYIEKNCTVGPNCYIRGRILIQENCHIGSGVEIKNSIIFSGTKIPHLSYVGDSIIGQGCNLGAGTIVSNLRHDGKNIKSQVNGILKDTGRRKFGTVFGDGVKTGIGTLIYPGRKIWPGKVTLPGQIVKEDIV